MDTHPDSKIHLIDAPQVVGEIIGNGKDSETGTDGSQSRIRFVFDAEHSENRVSYVVVDLAPVLLDKGGRAAKETIEHVDDVVCRKGVCHRCVPDNIGEQHGNFDLSANATDHLGLTQLRGKFDISGVLVGSQLEVTYLNRMFLSGKELERDELTFTLKPGPQVTADTTGTFDLTDINVVADSGSPHPFKLGDQTTFAGGKVMRLLGTDFTASAVLGTSVGDFDIVEERSNAFLGRAEALFMAFGKKNTPVAGLRRYIVFDAIRLGDGMVGNIFQITDDMQGEDLDLLDLAMTIRTASPAVLLSNARKTSAVGKKLVTFVTTLGGR